MAGLFGVKSQAITKHLKNIYATNELQLAATCSKMEQVQNEGGRSVSREVVFYNLDAIVAVGSNLSVSGIGECALPHKPTEQDWVLIVEESK